MTIFKRSYDFYLSTFQFQIIYGEWHVVGLHKECALGKKHYVLISYMLWNFNLYLSMYYDKTKVLTTALKIKFPQVINDLKDIGVHLEYIKSVICILKNKTHE